MPLTEDDGGIPLLSLAMDSRIPSSSGPLCFA